jgi:hypothetical protein
MQTVFIVISSVLTLSAGVPYLRDILRRKTKPRVVTWFVWSALTGLAAAASFSVHQYASAVVTLSESIETMTVVIVGVIIAADLAIEVFDIVCLCGAIVGLVLWWAFDSPSIAVLASVTIDLIGSLPTVKHMWQKPLEETWLTFALSSLSGLCALIAATSIAVTAIASPIDILFVNGVFVAIILVRRKHALSTSIPSKGMPICQLSNLLHSTPDGIVVAPTVKSIHQLKLRVVLSTQIPTLAWSSIQGAHKYNVYRNGVYINSTWETKYSDVSATQNTYRYHVTAVVGAHESQPSNEVDVVAQ